MDLLQHGIDRSVIALWLGHESVETTQMYLHADLCLKEQALSRTTPLGVKPDRHRPDDQLRHSSRAFDCADSRQRQSTAGRVPPARFGIIRLSA
jgi:hypothetical protein